jgi:hypothetical protein
MNAAILHTKDTYPQSVEVIVPLIIDMLAPQSVVDFGCGVGCWLSGFKHHDVHDILGIDGSSIFDKDLLIPQESYLPFDLERIRELAIDRPFDVALCLECAEHLDAEIAPQLVETLCRVAPHVVFSAAVPGQTGMGHKNEQYPDYWQSLFFRHGFQMYDYFRPLVWNDKRVEFWYRQNMYLFSRSPQHFRRPASEWDGTVYITRELLEIYVRWLGTRNAEKLINPNNIEMLRRSITPPVRPKFYRRLLAQLRHFVSQDLK